MFAVAFVKLVILYYLINYLNKEVFPLLISQNCSIMTNLWKLYLIQS